MNDIANIGLEDSKKRVTRRLHRNGQWDHRQWKILRDVKDVSEDSRTIAKRLVNDLPNVSIEDSKKWVTRLHRNGQWDQKEGLYFCRGDNSRQDWRMWGTTWRKMIHTGNISFGQMRWN